MHLQRRVIFWQPVIKVLPRAVSPGSLRSKRGVEMGMSNTSGFFTRSKQGSGVWMTADIMARNSALPSLTNPAKRRCRDHSSTFADHQSISEGSRTRDFRALTPHGQFLALICISMQTSGNVLTPTKKVPLIGATVYAYARDGIA